jgi:ABC-2 type transport system ATP-binding protein
MAIMDRGSVVLPGRPGDALDEVRGRIWRKRVSRESVQRYRDDFPVISVRLVGGEPVVHVYGEAEPEEGFSAVDPVLEDVYFHRVRTAAGAGAGA